ncbi:MAG: hypothetical protein QM725_01365 [Lacibacter sp.]
MITINNYISEIQSLVTADFPEALRKGHSFLLKATNNGSSWTSYQSSEAIKKTIDLYLSKLNEYVNNTSKATKKQTTKAKQQEDEKKLIEKTLQKQKAMRNHKEAAASAVTMVERIPDEIRFIRRFVNLDGKTKTREDVLRFVNSLQKAILEKRIRKTSAHAGQIRMIQKKLIDLYNTMKAKTKIELSPETHNQLKEIVGTEKVFSSVSLIKAYINLNGKPGMKKKADGLLQRITRMVDKQKIPANDPYIDELTLITKNLESFLNNPSEKTLSIEPNELNGLNGILGCSCNTLKGIPSKPAVMNSMDFANLQFNTIGLQGKWFDLIGDPSSNFTAMVFGKPKMGKSYLCIDFAGYLARHHGNVLYVAKEEGLDLTLQQKLREKSVAHPNLSVASILPANLNRYDFIFLDSVNKLQLKPEDLNKLKQQYPDKSFIYIFQSTKNGNFRGENSFQHDVDVVIEVPEKGKAVQFGRFNQGGEIDIF